MLGAMKISFGNYEKEKNNILITKMCFKEFYLHSGSVLDNLARLIYIINIKSAPTESADKHGNKKRHLIYYSQLKKVYEDKPADLKGYKRLIYNKKINEIVNIRNNFAHSWPPVIFFNYYNQLEWPSRMRKRSDYYLWPHDENELRKIKKVYRKKVLIIQMMAQDLKTIENIQNLIFKKLYTDIKKFERNHKLKII